MPTTLDQSQLLTRKEAAVFLGVTPETLAVWACEGRYALPYIKVGRLAKYRRSDLEKWLRARERNMPAEAAG